MKITILQGAFLPVPPAMGGAVEKMWFALGKEFVKRGHQVIHISRQYEGFPKHETIAGVSHKRVKGSPTPSSGLYLKWLDFLYTLKAKSKIPIDSDIIVTNTFWAPILLRAKLKRRCFVDVQRMPKGQLKWYKEAGRFRANSNVVVDAIKREIPANTYKKVVMVPNPLPFDVGENVDIGHKKRVLLFTGRIHPEKGLELLINACKNLQEGWSLKIVGPYDTAGGGGGEAYLHSLKKLAEGLPVEFTGPVYDVNALNNYYKEATVFVYPSIAEKGETFGLAPLEAMAWGCVPVVSNLACFQDFITHGSNGLVFDHRSDNAVELLSDALFKLANEDKYTSELVSMAIQVRYSHSISVIGGEFLKEFQKLILASN